MSLLKAFVLFTIVVSLTADRPKKKDALSNFLVAISDIPIGSCGGDSYFGLGVMDGYLEECERWKLTDAEAVKSYEEYKCKTLRVHGQVNSDGKCECSPSWKGPICNEFNGCPEGHSLYGKVCTANVCQHGGTLAVGKKEIECICPVPWDGRYCERLACWRKTNFGQEKRYRNNGDHCICGAHFTGENCDVVTSCLNDGQLEGGRCICKDGWYGELCEKKCPKGKPTCSSCQATIIFTVLVSILLAFI